MVFDFDVGAPPRTSTFPLPIPQIVQIMVHLNDPVPFGLLATAH